jgi:integrase
VAGIDRKSLFEKNEVRTPIRAYDLRATFIAISLANGTEPWASTRTGHRSSRMINRHCRIAQSVAELNLGDFTPLNIAIPELRGDGGPKL